MPETSFSDRCLNIREAADHLRISRAALYRLMRERRIKPVKIGSRTIFRGSELDRFLNDAALERVS